MNTDSRRQAIAPVARQSLHEAVEKRILDYIIDNGMMPGDPLPSENELAAGLQVSRSVVRESLRSLESLGLVDTELGRGRFVAEFNLSSIIQSLGHSVLQGVYDFVEIAEVRRALELSFISDAVANIGEEQIRVLRQLVTAMKEKSEAGEPYLREDLEFHSTIYSSTGNRFLTSLLSALWKVYEKVQDNPVIVGDPSIPEAHRAILEAVESSDASEARKKLEEHYQFYMTRLLTPQADKSEAESLGQ